MICNWRCCALWWRLSNITVQVNIMFEEKESCQRKCESCDLQILCFRCSLSWLTHIAENPLLIHYLVSCRKESGEPTVCFILAPPNLFTVIPTLRVWCLSIYTAQSIRFHSAACEQISRLWRHIMFLKLTKITERLKFRCLLVLSYHKLF